ncbi:hypothetical protein QJQ45_000303 [Haematococcus lacustris]|nr:hypothetical protein QJQ45_000303 [Haematococcus lacustris]
MVTHWSAEQAQGTFLDGKPVPAYKPTCLKDGATLTFAALPTRFIVTVESAGEKRSRSEAKQGTGSNSRRKSDPAMSVRASHLLVKHKDSRRPSSWKEPVVTRTQEEALDMIKAFHGQLVRGEADFATLASKESHCSSAQRGGDLGTFSWVACTHLQHHLSWKTLTPTAYERSVVLNLAAPCVDVCIYCGDPKHGEARLYPTITAQQGIDASEVVGELSGPVFTDSGVHLILRTA